MEDTVGAASFVLTEQPRLSCLVDTIVPPDEHPSGVEAGGLRFLERLLAERPDWVERVVAVLAACERASRETHAAAFTALDAEQRLAVLESLLDDADYRWFAGIVNGGYYADPGNGGNDDAASWSMVGWQPWPGTSRRPASSALPSDRRTIEPAEVLDRYDAIVVGSGAGGGVAACGLSEAGRTVLVVEAGSWPDTRTLATDHLRNPRSMWGLEAWSGPRWPQNPRVLDLEDGERQVGPGDPAWGSNAMTAGGGTRVYGAQAWRFSPEDFTMASRYGVPDGSALADWPFGYDELEPYYVRAEWEIGVSGDEHDGRHAGPRSRPFPMKPLPAGRARDRLEAGARNLGLGTLAVPLLINSTPYLDRPACSQCAMCVGFACPVDAKNGSQNTVLARALATGRTSVLVDTTVERLTVDGTGRVTGVAVVGVRDGVVWRREVRADEVVLSAGAVETARLLLNSRTEREPAGIGNNADQVGRHLQGHAYGGSLGIFSDELEELIGPGPSIATADFRHGNDGIVGGGIIANEFVPTPSNTYLYLSGAGVIPRHGPGTKRGMRDLSRRMVRLMGPVQEMTSADSRVRVDDRVRDRFGNPVARLGGGLHPEDYRARDFLTARTVDWMTAAGADLVVPMDGGRLRTPSGGQHQAGTCRMGEDPASSVVDPWGRVWGHDNLRVADGSVHVTNGGVNPVLTIFANAFRIVDHMVGAPTAGGPPR
ncbi:GMC family oxidoreductase [Microlunatus spumicola]|uniref:GMC family oxidoreductase n=1 Tax=Microlunatus spumicola TaxID=81499 RepID=A0ABP6XAG7_9ACTN